MSKILNFVRKFRMLLRLNITQCFVMLVNFGIIFLLTLLIMEGVLRFFPVRDMPHTAELKTREDIPRYMPNMEGTWSFDWNFKIVNAIQTNNYGFVNEQDYDETLSTPLAAVIGDSFVAALMIPYKQTFHGHLANRYKDKRRVYSFGISGAPMSTYLRWAQFIDKKFNPSHMIFTICDNDYDESYFKYKGYPSFYYFHPKEDGRLVLKEKKFHITKWRRYLARNSRLIAYLTQNVQVRARIYSLIYAVKNVLPFQVKNDSQRIAESKKAVDFFLEELEATVNLDKSRIMFVVNAVDELIYNKEVNLDSRVGFEIIMNTYFIRRAREHGYVVLPLQKKFEQHYAKHGQRLDFTFDGHWNAMAHKLISEAIVDSGLFETE